MQDGGDRFTLVVLMTGKAAGEQAVTPGG